MSECSENISECSENISECSENFSECSENFSERSENFSECSENISERSENISERSENISERTEMQKKGGKSAIYAFFAEPARFFCEFGRNVCYTFADIFNQRSKTMKNTINKIILFAAVFAAGLYNISANAQVGVDMPAMAEVWIKPGFTVTSGDTNIDFDMTIPEIYNMHSTEVDFRNATGFVFLVDDLAGLAANVECPSVGLCYQINGMTVFLKAGDNVRLGADDHERNFDAATDTDITPTVLIYTTNPGGELAFGQYSGTVGVAESGEFYLDDNWEETDIGAARGFVPVQCSAGFISNDDITCECSAGERVNAEGSCETIPATCGANAINNPNDNTMCVCENTETHQFVAGSTTDCEPIPTNPNTPTCEEHEMLNSSDECVNRTAENCGNGEVFSPVNTGGICQTPAAFFAANTITVAARYSAESCERAGWISSIAINNEKTAAAELCGIPVVRDDSVTITAAAAESVPLQFPENENANGCIIRESADFLTLPDCNDSQLFGDGGFPQMPENFNIATDRLIVAVVADGRNRVFFNGNEIRTAVASLQNNETEVAIFGAVGIAMAAFAIVDFFHNGRPADAFAFSPEFNYSISESDYFVRAGGKIEYAVNEKLRMQWSAGQTNTGGDFGDFRYLSKAEYKTDLFAAAFSESVAGETANYNFSLSADVDGRLVDFSPVYRLHSEYDKGEFSTRNELNLQGNFRYNGWTINPSAGFRWENTNDFAENARFQINAIHRF